MVGSSPRPRRTRRSDCPMSRGRAQSVFGHTRTMSVPQASGQSARSCTRALRGRSRPRPNGSGGVTTCSATSCCTACTGEVAASSCTQGTSAAAGGSRLASSMGCMLACRGRSVNTC
ncbi:hypothetical protein H257_18071 [Aphanomyces astaci]|uniref:Uncharacterized protein n=1 Tax=Aphanomyces astaci TaxID=112090 RepID=W4FCF7_APHAT|nr:hypothetical protein H257_18071 [Aphanomyces astaci]ETV65145.1 hypothetical protein H257_18071 [Aphanomyces astaci]|eukprot:XP_009845383.1 hypothetical protein H257_18071 [Aphanomyces astaci]